MILFASIDWPALFVPKVSLLELVVRGSVMYLGAFAALRVFRRAAGALGTADLLLIVLIAGRTKCDVGRLPLDYRGCSSRCYHHWMERSYRLAGLSLRVGATPDLALSDTSDP
jgi:hypothetical protein